MTYILKPFAMLLLVLSQFTSSYGLGLILFTLIIKVILFPFNLKSKKSMIQSQAIQGQVQKIQKQYANNPQLMNEKINQLYQETGASPMGGCVWTLIPLVLLIALYAIIRQPLTHIMGLSTDEITQVSTVLEGLGETIKTGSYQQMYMAEGITRLWSQVTSALPDLASKLKCLNFSFLGVNLADQPNFRFWQVGSLTWSYIGLFLIPIISAVSGLFSSWYSMKVNNMRNTSQNAAGQGMNKAMLIYMPVMSLIIGFCMPAALGIYWIASNVFTLISEMLFKVILKGEYERAEEQRIALEKRMEEEEAQRKIQEREERARRIEAEKEARKTLAKRRELKKQKKAEKDPSVNREDSRVGMRTYARGRNYDPYRFSPDGPTPYRDPEGEVDEEKLAQVAEEKELKAEVDEMLKNGNSSAAENTGSDNQED